MDKVDISNALLNDALKQRQSFMYNLASTLANTPVQQGYGSWLSNLTNAFGRAYKGGIDSDIERQKAQDLSNALQSEKLSDAAKVAAIYGDTGLAQQLLTAQATNDYRQAQLEESRLNREFNRAIKEQELAQKTAEDEAEREYRLEQLGLRRDELAGTQEYRNAQLDIDRAGVDVQRARLEQDAAKLAQQAAEDEAQRAYLMEKLGTETQLSQADQALKQAQLEQTGAYRNARLAQEQAKIDNAMAQQKAMSDFYSGKNVDYSKLPVKVLEEAAKEKRAQEEKAQQIESAKGAMKDLMELANSGAINAMNKSSDNWFLSGESSNRIGKREAALAALLPLTNTVAKQSGGSGINTLGEMMAYLGIPVNATSAQIAGALPGIARKIGIDLDEIKEMLGSSAPATNTISVGSVRSGYRFKGGDPKKKENWEKI